MKTITLFLMSLISLFASERFDSATNIALDAHLKQASILSSVQDSDEKLKKNIIRQLKYLIGPLNHHNGTPDLGHVDITITQKIADQDGELQKTFYDAKFLVSWDQSKPIPKQFDAILPLSMKSNYLKKF